MAGHRIARVEHQIAQLLGQLIIKGEVKDYRVNSMLSVSSVEVSRDLAYAKVSISGYLQQKELYDAVEGLNSAAGFIQSKVAKHMRTRNTPRLTFYADTGIADGMEINKKIDSLNILHEEHEIRSTPD